MLLQRNKKKQYIKVGELRMSENAEINVLEKRLSNMTKQTYGKYNVRTMCPLKY